MSDWETTEVIEGSVLIRRAAIKGKSSSLEN